MKSNYSQLGKYIKEVNIRNSDLAITNLLGVSMEKTFIPSVANITGVDMSVYKVLKKNQLACKLMSVGRDEKLPVDLYREENPAIVSSAYYVFEPRNENELLPEYLIMWLCRPENDRFIGFISGGDVRGGISWETFCSLPIKVPHITKQKEIVKEYNIIQKRIALNLQLIKKMEETAQAIYKAWFVDFEFLDENGLSYKSNGGEMVESELGEVPVGWNFGKMGDITKIIMGQSPDGDSYNIDGTGTPLINGPVEFGEYFTNKTKWTTKLTKLSEIGDLVICVRGSTTGRFVKSDGKYCLGRGVCSFRAKQSQRFVDQVYISNLSQLLSYTTGSTFPNWDGQTLLNYPILIPELQIILKFEKIINPIMKKVEGLSKENILLDNLRNLLLSKLATIEN